MKNIYYGQVHLADSEGRKREIEAERKITSQLDGWGSEVPCSAFNFPMAIGSIRRINGKYYFSMVETLPPKMISSITEFTSANEVIDFALHSLTKYGVKRADIDADFKELGWTA
jgi:hypothetical protein